MATLDWDSLMRYLDEKYGKNIEQVTENYQDLKEQFKHLQEQFNILLAQTRPQKA